MNSETEIQEVQWINVTERAKDELAAYMENNEHSGKIVAIISAGFG